MYPIFSNFSLRIFFSLLCICHCSNSRGWKDLCFFIPLGRLCCQKMASQHGTYLMPEFLTAWLPLPAWYFHIQNISLAAPLLFLRPFSRLPWQFDKCWHNLHQKLNHAASSPFFSLYVLTNWYTGGIDVHPSSYYCVTNELESNYLFATLL